MSNSLANGKRCAVIISAATVLVSGFMAVSASSAAAAPNYRFVATAMQKDGSRGVNIYVDGRLAGIGQWVAKGDTLRVRDLVADGRYITAHLGTGRHVSTAGKKAPVVVSKGGNLPEGKAYKMWACVVKKGEAMNCSKMLNVKA